jgi:hypothetical protein
MAWRGSAWRGKARTFFIMTKAKQTKKTTLTPKQAAELERIIKQHGGAITAEELLGAVTRAKESSTLRSLIFDCDDDEAAERYRVERCRWVLRHARFDFKAVGNPHPLETRRVLHVPEGSADAYVLTERATKGEQRKYLVEECRAELERWRGKWTAVLGRKLVGSLLSSKKS